MSLPFLRIGTPVYATSSEVMTIPMVGKRLRGSQQQLRVDGFSQSKTFNISRGSFVGSYTFSVTDLETSTASVGDTTTYASASESWTFGGTAAVNDSVTITSTDLSQLFVYTFSATQSAADAVDELVATMSVNATGDWAGFTAERVGNAFKLDAPWGAYYNGLNVTATIATQSGSTLIISQTASELTGGVTQYNLEITVPGYRFDAGTKTFNFRVGTYAVGS